MKTLVITSVTVTDSFFDVGQEKHFNLSVEMDLTSLGDFSDYVSDSGTPNIDKIMLDIMNGKIQIKGIST